jgi:hypothetical protein
VWGHLFLYDCNIKESDYALGLFLAGPQIFLFVSTSRLALEPTQTHMWLVQWVLSSEVKWLQHEADHPPQSSVKVKHM